MPYLLIAGDMLDVSFTETVLIAEDIASGDPSLTVETRPMLEADFAEYITEKIRTIRGKVFEHGRGPFVLHSQFGYLGGIEGMASWATNLYQYEDPRKHASYESIAAHLRGENSKAFDKYMRKTGRKYCYFDFEIGNAIERVTFELFNDVCPRTCDNFIGLCTGSYGVNPDGATLNYEGTPIHRVLKGAWMQGGDIMNGRGTYSKSVWGSTFEDESFAVTFDKPGILAMANTGPHTNGSQFFISMGPIESFNSKKVAFGRVIGGTRVLALINAQPQRNQRPRTPIIIKSCGELTPTEKETSTEDEKVEAEEAETPPTKSATVVVIGLDAAGKTSICNHYTGKQGDAVDPTNGFEFDTCVHARTNVTVFGLGGDKGIRGYWDNYYDEAHGVIYVFDSGDADRLEEACAALRQSLKHEKVQQKPILIYLNKQDLNPLSGTELLSTLEQDLKESGCAHKFVGCTALCDPSADRDSSILGGLTWLLDRVDDDRDSLEKRVNEDVAHRKAVEKAARDERRRQKALNVE